MPPPLILLPGLKSDHRVWQPQIDALGSRSDVIVPVASLDCESIAGMATAVLAGAPERFALAGCSMGGYVALQIMRLAPERVERLALVSTSARPENPATTPLRHAALALARRDGVGAMAAAGLGRDFHRAHRDDAGLAALMVAMAETVGLDIIERQMRAVIARPDARLVLASIRCPTAIVVGEQDQVTPPDCSRELVAAIAGSTLSMIPDCGHCASLETPGRVTAALQAWMEA
ncbi:alpha/beta fold hydrolase [Bradyrhizobium sp.]|uniref:alpha/beta fold hydrolase n=1 Tax=Bradyrhizobium sp. TaxID=376 RepID=UPI0039E62AEF